MPSEGTAIPGAVVSPRPFPRLRRGQVNGGRYRLEFHPYGCPSCRLRTPHAFLLLSFLVEEVEAEREVSDLVCSRCEPERFARLQQLAPHLA